MNDHERADQIRRFVDEVWNGRNYAVAGDLYGADYTSPYGTGPAAKAAGIRLSHQAFPDDMRVDIDDLIITGETAVLRFTLRGTDRGGYAGHAPTGRTVEEWAINIMHFENDRVVSEWMGADKLGLFIQLGIVDDPWPKPSTS